MKQKSKKPKPPVNQIALLLALLTFLTRFSYIFNFLTPNQYIEQMPYQNHRRATSVLETGEAFYGNAWGTYYLVLAGQYSLLNSIGISDTTTSSVIIHIIATSIAVFFFYKLAAKLTTPNLAILSSLLLMLYFPSIYLNAQLLAENLFLPLLIIGFYLLIPPPKKTINYLLSGIFFSLATAIRPILLPFLPLLILWQLKTRKQTNKPLKSIIKAFSFTLAASLVLASFIFLNQRFSSQHLLQLNAGTGVNFALAQCKIKKLKYDIDGESYWFSPPMRWDTNFEDINTDIPFYNQEHYYKMGLRCLFDNPAQLKTNFTHIKNVFDSTFYPKFNPKPHIENLITFWKVASIISLIFFLLYPLTVTKKQRRYYAPFFLLLISLFLSVYMANPGEERYLIPYAWIFFLFTPPTIKKFIT